MELHLSDRYILALNFLLVTVLAYFGFLAAKDLLSLRGATIEAPAQQRRHQAADDSAAKRPRAAYQAIVERDIFNLVPPPPPPAPIVVEDLHVALVGVSQATKGRPYAIIADARGDQGVYRVGEMIPDSGKLLEVGKDRVVIDHGGKHVVVELPKTEMGDGEGTGPRRLSAAEASRDDAASHYRERMRRRLGHRE